ncbi:MULTISPECIES: hypothetical protein [unclassified Cupriavidus]|jgi:hypothetical protein|uniref:hypothetical protein n=1 Tax=unclassified Cupriavidus TaxID=2640874 RepID=UPI001C006A29|nr:MULTISPECIES: hypothetical protein [unclassified Cupriavidus]MCA3185789.1 hypothetical protein [Cupriavidus sp.]MCA3188767.1 hypothetical protein [Cupriavidus sp.]MCA3198487.1 hypothetical protein [Cupriavidus sp.]MCA3201233.1 hypothetical protein [Cupriavidus sp.]MCA3210438.1 hypothetical protein [Cupriavidus sp.]
MSLTLLAAAMAALLTVTVVLALWRCGHPYRTRYTRCARRRKRAGLCREMRQRHSHVP